VRQVNVDRLVRDLYAVVADVDELIKATAGNANEAIVEVRERIASSLRAAKDNLRDAGQCAAEEAGSIADATNDYVHDNVWKVMGIAGGIGLLVGMILSLRSGYSRSRPPTA
jgi:ElaB/YqjD/DUF883 family membrane-anchored ribosome-binding protein